MMNTAGYHDCDDGACYSTSPDSVSPLSGTMTPASDIETAAPSTKATFTQKLYNLKRASGVKARGAHHPLLVIFVLFTIATTGLVSINLGLWITVQALTTYLHSVEGHYASATASSNVCYLMESRRDKLLSSSLSIRIFETHPECLVRAINTAHNNYYLLPYEDNQEILNDTITWAEEQCAKRAFALQILPHSRDFLSRAWGTVTETTGTAFKSMKGLRRVWFDRIHSRSANKCCMSYIHQFQRMLLCTRFAPMNNKQYRKGKSERSNARLGGHLGALKEQTRLEQAKTTAGTHAYRPHAVPYGPLPSKYEIKCDHGLACRLSTIHQPCVSRPPKRFLCERKATLARKILILQKIIRYSKAIQYWVTRSLISIMFPIEALLHSAVIFTTYMR